jgi:hypothetical protein
MVSGSIGSGQMVPVVGAAMLSVRLGGSRVTIGGSGKGENPTGTARKTCL